MLSSVPGKSGRKENKMSTTLLIIVILLILGLAPSWGYSRRWGWGPSGGLGFILLVLLVLYLLGAFR